MKIYVSRYLRRTDRIMISRCHRKIRVTTARGHVDHDYRLLFRCQIEVGSLDGDIIRRLMINLITRKRRLLVSESS